MVVNGNFEYSGASSQDAQKQPQSDGVNLSHNCTAGELPTANTEENTSLLGNIRTMLIMAVEGAYDLRAGKSHNSYLARFEDLLAAQTQALDVIANSESVADQKFLARRAHETLNDFAQAVQQQIIEAVRPDIASRAFDAALEAIKGPAVAAGAACGSIDLARQRL